MAKSGEKVRIGMPEEKIITPVAHRCEVRSTRRAAVHRARRDIRRMKTPLELTVPMDSAARLKVPAGRSIHRIDVCRGAIDAQAR